MTRHGLGKRLKNSRPKWSAVPHTKEKNQTRETRATISPVNYVKFSFFRWHTEQRIGNNQPARRRRDQAKMNCLSRITQEKKSTRIKKRSNKKKSIREEIFIALKHVPFVSPGKIHCQMTLQVNINQLK